MASGLGITKLPNCDPDDVDGRTVLCRNPTYKLEAAKVCTLLIAICCQGFDERGVFAVAKRLGVETEIHVEGAHMRHFFVIQKQPGNCSSNNGVLAPEAPEYLADLNQHAFDCGSRAVFVVGGRLRLARPYFFHVSLSFLRCSAASCPRSPAALRSRYVWVGLVQIAPGVGSMVSMKRPSPLGSVTMTFSPLPIWERFRLDFKR